MHLKIKLDSGERDAKIEGENRGRGGVRDGVKKRGRCRRREGEESKVWMGEGNMVGRR